MSAGRMPNARLLPGRDPLALAEKLKKEYQIHMGHQGCFFNNSPGT
jgi:hypothetical protein